MRRLRAALSVVVLPCLAATAHASGGEAGDGVPKLFSWLDFLHVSHAWQPAIFAFVVGFGILPLVTWRLIGPPGRRLARLPDRKQALVEVVVEALRRFCANIIGPGGEKYAPFVGSLFLYIYLMNILGFVPGFHSPTSNWHINFSMAAVVFVSVQGIAVRTHGLAYFRHFLGEPLWLAPLMAPVHIIGELVKPLSLSLRLFGNIMGEDTVIAVLVGLGAHFVIPFTPLHFPMLLLGLLTTFIQAMIFSLLTAVYLSQVIHLHGEEDHEEARLAEGPARA